MRLIVTYHDLDIHIGGTEIRSRIIDVDCPELELALSETCAYRQITLSYEMPKSKESTDMKF